MGKEPFLDTRNHAHQRTIRAQETGSQGMQRLHHQRDMILNNTIFLNAIVFTLKEVGLEFFRHSPNTEF
jgi:hypothetical protein